MAQQFDAESNETEDNHLANYKGEFCQDQDTKYQDPVTGAHFRYEDMCRRLLHLQRQAAPSLFTEPSPANDAESRLFRTQEPLNNRTKREAEPDFRKLSTMLRASLPDRGHNRQPSCPGLVSAREVLMLVKRNSNAVAGRKGKPQGVVKPTKLVSIGSKTRGSSLQPAATTFASLYF